MYIIPIVIVYMYYQVSIAWYRYVDRIYYNIISNMLYSK